MKKKYLVRVKTIYRDVLTGMVGIMEHTPTLILELKTKRQIIILDLEDIESIEVIGEIEDNNE